MKYLDKNKILGTSLRTAEIEIEEWGGTALIQEPSVADAKFLASLPEDRMRAAYWVVKCLVNKDGTRVFQDSDVPNLAEKSSTVVTWLVDEIIDRFGLAEKKARWDKQNEPPSESPKS